MAYKIVIATKTGDLELTTEKRALARSVALVAKENELQYEVTVPATTKEREVKFAGLD